MKREWLARSRQVATRACMYSCRWRLNHDRTTWPRPPVPLLSALSGSTRHLAPRRSSRRTGKARYSSTRPRAGGATMVAAYSPRVRPGVPVSFPVAWEDLDRIAPADFTLRTAPGLLDQPDPWMEQMPPPQQ